MVVPDEALQLFQAAMRVMLRDGQNTLFWEDRWLDGFRIEELAPTVYAKVSARIHQSRRVCTALVNHA